MSWIYKKKRPNTMAASLPLFRFSIVLQTLLALDAFLALYEKGVLFRHIFNWF